MLHVKERKMLFKAFQDLGGVIQAAVIHYPKVELILGVIQIRHRLHQTANYGLLVPGGHQHINPGQLVGPIHRQTRLHINAAAKHRAQAIAAQQQCCA